MYKREPGVNNPGSFMPLSFREYIFPAFGELRTSAALSTKRLYKPSHGILLDLCQDLEVIRGVFHWLIPFIGSVTKPVIEQLP